MSQQGRITVFIDIFHLVGEEARPLQNLTAVQLIAHILQEFAAEIPFLLAEPRFYVLGHQRSKRVLTAGKSLAEQGVSDQDRLILREALPELPDGTVRPSRPVYLQEVDRNLNHAVFCVPGVIGRQYYRPDDNQLVADLTLCAMAERVSRRQAQIEETDGQFFLRRLADNPVLVDGVRVETRPVLLQNGSAILLERSGISLRFFGR